MYECERCPKNVVALANAVMQLENEPLVSISSEGGQLHHVHHKTPQAEAKGLAQEISRVFRADAGAGHLVLVTRRKWGYDLRQAIHTVDPNIPVSTRFSEDILQAWPAREAFLLFALIADSDDPVTWRDWLSYQEPDGKRSFKAPERNAGAYLWLKQNGGVLSTDRARNLAQQPRSFFKGAGGKNIKLRLDRWAALTATLSDELSAGELVGWCFNPARWVAEGTPNEELAREDIGRLRSAAESLLGETEGRTAASVLRDLRTRIATRQPLGDEKAEGVQIVTLWGAKGLTADYVYIMGLVDEALPGPLDTDSTGFELGEHLAEQRRLLYVSLTRARKALVLSRPLKIRAGVVPLLRLAQSARRSQYWRDLQLCRFLRDLPAGTLPDSTECEGWEGVKIPSNDAQGAGNPTP